MSLPNELKLREDRLGAMATAKAKIAQRAAERYHWISSQALELISKDYRIVALPAEIMQAKTTAHLPTLAKRSLMPSIRWAMERSVFNAELPKVLRQVIAVIYIAEYK